MIKTVLKDKLISKITTAVEILLCNENEVIIEHLNNSQLNVIGL